MFKLINNYTQRASIFDKYSPFICLHVNRLIQVSFATLVDISYTGKTYKWKIKKSCIRCTFNRANKTHVVFKNKYYFKKMSKTKIRLFVLTKRNTMDTMLILKKIRRLNIFTLRGIKIQNTNIYKKRGKISTYKHV